MDIDTLLRDLYEIGHEQGLHTGRWEDEYMQEYSSEIWFEAMIEYANKYGIETYSKEYYYDAYKEELDSGEYRKYNVLDEVATDLRDEIIVKIAEEIKSKLIL